MTKPVCKTCNDTHRMTLHLSNGDEQVVMCTFCPAPCMECRADGKGAFCEKTPCECGCHAKEERRGERYLVVADSLTRAVRMLVEQIRAQDSKLGSVKMKLHCGAKVTIDLNGEPLKLKKREIARAKEERSYPVPKKSGKKVQRG